MNSIYSIILQYKSGRRPFGYIGMADLADTFYDEVYKFASQYNVIPEEYGTSFEEVKSYIMKLNSLRSEIEQLERKKSDDSFMALIFCVGVSLIECALIFCTVSYFVNIGWLLIILLACPFVMLMLFSEEYLYPQFRKWNHTRIDWNFYSKHGIIYNFKIHRFIDEILFRAFAENRDPKGLITN